MIEKRLSNPTINKIEMLVKITQRNKWITFFLITLPIVITIYSILKILNFGVYPSLAVPTFLLVISCIIFTRTNTYRQINANNIVEHINRYNPELEESAQLLLNDPEVLSLVQKIQFKKIKLLFDVAFNDRRLSNCLPRIKFKLAGVLSLVALIILFFSGQLNLLLNNLSELNSDMQTSDTQSLIEQKVSSTNTWSPRLISSQVKVMAPIYSKVPVAVSANMDLTILEGSSVHWSFNFTSNDVEYYLIGAGSEKMQKLKFISVDTLVNTNSQSNAKSSAKSSVKSKVKSSDKNKVKNESKIYRYEFERTIVEPSIYRVVYRYKNQLLPLPGVYSMSVTIDKSPKIKLIKPNRSLVEIGREGDPSFSLEALVSDDYGITEVSILASVAKGSGEAVKFRDKKFEFESTAERKTGRVYSKQWSLTELDMESGDEVYFSIIAKDNKEPEPQLTKSSTVIVRWLDNEEFEVAEGVGRIAFVPEYFRSQRQIIIETEELIEDQKDLTPKRFDELSSELGYSQRDLREKFGQYLGDEIGEGPDGQYGLADGYHGGENLVSGEVGREKKASENGSDLTHDDEVEKLEVGHSHKEMIEQQDLSGKSEIIARFAHNHGEGEIGPISKRDPKSWMKLAVNEMWQAELHLMLSEPKKALPYEYLAYKYLKLARQADRIYAKRLGFEPPPVSEERRLTGELSAILNYSLSVEYKPNSGSDDQVITDSYQLLSSKKITGSLSTEQKALFNDLKAKILEMSNTRPVLLKYAAMLERILITGNIRPEDCQQCVVALKQKLWQLLPEPLSIPNVKVELKFSNDSATRNFRKKIENIKQSQSENINAEYSE